MGKGEPVLLNRRLVYNRLLEPKVRKCVKELDHVYCHARYTIGKAKKLFELDYEPGFLPNPVVVPESLPVKSGSPTVLFLGRFDGEKNPEAFMRLAQSFPEVQFIAAGASHDKEFDNLLRTRYADVENLSLPGFIDREEKNRALDDAWVLVNTSISECLPVSFLEAAAHGCSILCPHDPDGFASSFGLHTTHEKLVTGLSWLLEDERWRERGREGYEYVKEHHEAGKVVKMHLGEYRRWLS